jgi:hypothetical protein
MMTAALAGESGCHRIHPRVSTVAAQLRSLLTFHAHDAQMAFVSLAIGFRVALLDMSGTV